MTIRAAKKAVIDRRKRQQDQRSIPAGQRPARAGAAPRLSPDLKSLVNRSVALLGQVIKRELGASAFARIERIRKAMASLRDRSPESSFAALTRVYSEVARLDPRERRAIALSFTLMLELMNTCENAYRSHRLKNREFPFLHSKSNLDGVIYVLTAHPTEARAPGNISVFHDIESVLERILRKNREGHDVKIDPLDENDLLHLLEVAWRAPIVREKAPEVADEANHIYSTSLRREILSTLIEVSETRAPFFFRSWVGGDKDGHPGVSEKTLMQSLNLSRERLLEICLEHLESVERTLSLLPPSALKRRARNLKQTFRALGTLRAGDARRVSQLRKELSGFWRDYQACLGALHPSLRSLRRIMRMFPALVVPLELRESSDVLMSGEPQGPHAKAKRLAIDRMLEAIARLSKGGEPRWYARGLIISMTESIDHIRAAARKQERVFGAIRLPVIPLFEQTSALAQSVDIVREMTKDRKIAKAARAHWDGLLEIMVGYSDSAKEAGVLPSRLAIASALPRLESICASAGLTPVFFHGSGGSVDRGGGSIEDQTAWWPKAALRLYKVTVQGEMVERSLATPAIAERTIEQIIESAMKGLSRQTPITANTQLGAFADKVAASYRKQIHSPEFLEVVARATPYSYLKYLRIGSRPVKRSKQLTVSGLRAIPWVLCWTQTRVLFPTWWGVGSAWDSSPTSERSALKKAFRKDPVFTSYVKALGFTLAKVELPVWRLYLERSPLSRGQVERTLARFEKELALAHVFFKEVSGQESLLWFRPWLGESIRLRAPMIHPLNILQILAEKEKDVHLLRICVTGISSGMLTTG